MRGARKTKKKNKKQKKCVCIVSFWELFAVLVFLLLSGCAALRARFATSLAPVPLIHFTMPTKLTV